MNFSSGYENEAETSTRHGSWVIFDGTARDSDGNSSTRLKIPFPTMVVLLSARRHISVYADFKHLVKAVSIIRRVDVGLSPKESNKMAVE